MNFYHQDYFIKETSNSDLQYNIGYYEPNIYNINSNYKGTLELFSALPSFRYVITGITY